MSDAVGRLMQVERRRQGAMLAAADIAAAAAGAAGVVLLGLSGWFIVAAGVAGLGAAAASFNYLLPAAGVRLMAILRTGGRYGERLAGHAAALRSLGRIRAAVFAGVAASPASQALALSTGEACARLVQDVDALQTLFIRASARWGAGAALVAGLGLDALAGWPCALLLAVAAAAQVFAARSLSRASRLRWGAAAQESAGRLKATCAALLAAAPEIAAYRLQSWAAERVAKSGEGLAAARLAAHRAEAWQASLSLLIASAAALAVLVEARHGPGALAVLAALSTLAALEAVAGATRAFEADGAAVAARRRLEPCLAAEPPTPTAEPVFRNGCDLELADARGWRLRFGAGQRVALLGRSGAGKTTLIEQLLKLRDAPARRLAIGGIDVTALSPTDARSAFAYAPQAPTLLSGTIRDNLALADPGATPGQMWDVLLDAALDERVRGAPAGLDSDVGEAGAALSGGEQKRLSLARAYLRPAPWLVLDEPTEGLDEATESRVVARLAARLARTGQGLLLASHRPAPRALCVMSLPLDADAPDGTYRSASDPMFLRPPAPVRS